MTIPRFLTCNRPQFRGKAAVWAAFVLSVLSGSAEEPPNLILILTDDQAWGDVELSGNPIVDTPNLNRIAAEGMQFNRFYSAPMCSPTRAGLLTGRHNLRTGVSWVGRRTEMLGLDEQTLPGLMKERGYATGCFGKWHLGAYGPYHPNHRGFDEFVGHLGGALNDYYQSALQRNGKPFRSDGYITDLLTDYALEFMKANRDGPFFCYLPYNVPHHPFQAPDAYFQKYKDRGVEDDKTAMVYAMMDNMDENIGRILQKLREWKIERNTIIMFFSDNGPQFFRYNGGMKGRKAQVSEGGVRVPFYVRWPAHVSAGTSSSALTSHIDILPTMLEILGIESLAIKPLDGESLLPLLKGASGWDPDRLIFAHQTVFGRTFSTPGSVRNQRYVLENHRREWELYDLLMDPSQKRNIASSQPEVTQFMITAYEEWFADVTASGMGLPPIPIGYPGHDREVMIVPDAEIKGGLVYSDKHGWATDWLQNWASVEDQIIFPVDVRRSGDYRFVVHYYCEPEDVGAQLALEGPAGRITATVDRAHHPDFVRLPNHEMPMTPMIREWSRLELGTLALQQGFQELILSATDIPGAVAGEIRALEVVRLP